MLQVMRCDVNRFQFLKLFGHVARADKSQDHSRALQACISPAPRNWRRRPGRSRHTWLRTVEEDLCQFNLGLASGFRELKTEQLGGHSQEQQRHRQAPIDDDTTRRRRLQCKASTVFSCWVCSLVMPVLNCVIFCIFLSVFICAAKCTVSFR